MHKKKIAGKTYFYTSVKDKKGNVKTIYLGSTKRKALRKQSDLGLHSPKSFFSLSVILVMIGLLLVALFSGFFAFTGFNVIDITDTIGDLIEQSFEEDADNEIVSGQVVYEKYERGEPTDDGTPTFDFGERVDG